MKFAHFSHVWMKPGMTPAERYAQLWRELELADGLGFDFGFCVEHHFRPDESWMSAPSLYAVAAGARTRRIRLGAMGYIVPLHHPVRLAEEIALADQMIGGRLEVGLVPGIVPSYFEPFSVDYQTRRQVTLAFAASLATAYTKEAKVTLAVPPVQQPHPPLWVETRDPATLEFCAAHGINSGYFLVFPRAEAAPRYRRYLEQWREKGWPRRPCVAYSTVVYVDRSEAAARAKALARAGQAYRGFFPPTNDKAELRAFQRRHAELFEERGEAGAAEIMRNLLDPDYLLSHDLILIGSPDQVAERLEAFARDGVFNTFFGEFNFADLPEEDLMRSIRLFGTEVMPRLRGFEPF